MTTQLRIPDASCGHCKATIESTVKDLAGVGQAELDLSTNLLTVQHSESLDAGEISDAVRSAGYTPEPTP